MHLDFFGSKSKSKAEMFFRQLMSTKRPSDNLQMQIIFVEFSSSLSKSYI